MGSYLQYLAENSTELAFYAQQIYNPNIAKAPISAALTNEVMAELNRQRSAEGRSPRRVARDWLGQHGFIASGS